MALSMKDLSSICKKMGKDSLRKRMGAFIEDTSEMIKWMDMANYRFQGKLIILDSSSRINSMGKENLPATEKADNN